MLVLLRFGADDLGLRVVPDRARLAADLRAGLGVADDAGVGGREPLRTVAGVAVLLRPLLGLRVGEVAAAAGDGLDLVVLGAPDLHGDRRRRPDGLDGDAGRRLVLEGEVDDAAAVVVLEDGRLAGRGVAADVVAVLLVTRVGHGGEVRGVVERGGELRDAAADLAGWRARP